MTAPNANILPWLSNNHSLNTFTGGNSNRASIFQPNTAPQGLRYPHVQPDSKPMKDEGDATGPTFLGTYSSGGAVVSPVQCNGTLPLPFCLFPLMAQTCTTATCTAATPGESDVLAALPSTCPTGTTVVNIPSGNSTWTTSFTYAVPANCNSLTIQGNTTVSCVNTPGASNYSCSAADNTIIQDNLAIQGNPLMIFGITSIPAFFSVSLD